MAVDRLYDMLLLIGRDADGFERLPGSAVRADEGLLSVLERAGCSW